MKDIHKIKPERSANGRNLRYGNPKTKLQLMKDFNKCCGYCGDIHHYSGGFRSYHVDHFAPKIKFGDISNSYDNLVYSCPYCNLSKSDKWVGTTYNENIKDGIGIIDPCDIRYSEHLKRNDDGSITYTSSIGEYMYYELKLYLERHKIIYQLEELKNKIEAIQKKIEFNNTHFIDIQKLSEMEAILCKAYFYYHKELCNTLDEALT